MTVTSNIKREVTDFFLKGNKRTLLAKKNIALSFLIKGGAIIISMCLVPITIDYITPKQYGLWLTLSSIIGWISFLDVGIGNGLKNMLAQAISLNKLDEAKSLISTTYATLGSISIMIFSVLHLLNPYVEWNIILNISSDEIPNIKTIIEIIIVCFCIQFIVQIINVVLFATHQSAIVSAISLGSQFSILLLLYIIPKSKENNLINFICIIAGVPAIVQVYSSILLYKNNLKTISPNLRMINLKNTLKLLGNGGKFFIVQIAALVLFQTDNIIITQILGPAQVSVFNISYKLYSIIIMSFTIIMTPLWSAFTDAYTQNDFVWIKNSLKKMKQIWLLFTGLTIVLLLISPWIFKYWLGNKIEIPIILSTAMAIYVIAYTWQTLHVFMLNGIGKIKIQLILVVISAIANVPIAIHFGKHYGLAGIISANTIFFIAMGIIFSVQCNLIAKQKAFKLWAE